MKNYIHVCSCDPFIRSKYKINYGGYLYEVFRETNVDQDGICERCGHYARAVPHEKFIIKDKPTYQYLDTERYICHYSDVHMLK